MRQRPVSVMNSRGEMKWEVCIMWILYRSEGRGYGESTRKGTEVRYAERDEEKLRL